MIGRSGHFSLTFRSQVAVVFLSFFLFFFLLFFFTGPAPLRRSFDVADVQADNGDPLEVNKSDRSTKGNVFFVCLFHFYFFFWKPP